METKIIVAACAVVMGLVAAGFAFMSEQTLMDEKAGTVFSNPTGFVVKYLGGEKETVPFRAELSYSAPQNIIFSFDSIDSFFVDFGPESKFTVSGLSLRSAEGGSIEFVDYAGKVEIKDMVMLSGSSKRVRTDTNTFSKEKYIKVDGADVVFSRILLSKIDGQSINLMNMTGNVEINVDNGVADVPIDNKEVKIEGFVGELQYYPDRIVIDGEGRLDLGFMKAPSN